MKTAAFSRCFRSHTSLLQTVAVNKRGIDTKQGQGSYYIQTYDVVNNDLSHSPKGLEKERTKTLGPTFHSALKKCSVISHTS